MSLLEKVKTEKLIAILRKVPEEKTDQTAQALVDGGIKILEITLDSPGALPAIRRWKERFGDQVQVGAGTILDVETARKSIQAGADFLITPNLDEDIVTFALEQNIEICPGVMTPTEMVRAWKLGAKAVKLFPAGALGVSYIKDIRGPLSHIPIITTGGVNLSNIQSFLQAGVTAVGLGSSLVDKRMVAENRFDELSKLAVQYVKAAQAGSVHI